MSKKIAIIASHIDPTMQSHLLEWYKDIEQEKLKVQLFIGSKKKEIPYAKNYKVNSRFEKLKYKLYSYFHFKDLCQEIEKVKPLYYYQAKVIHLLTSNAFSTIEPLLDAQKTKLIVSFRGYDLNVFPFQNKENLELTLRLFQKADILHFISQALMNTAISMGANANKCVLIYRSIDTNKTLLNKKKSDTVVITSIGRLVWEKGYDYALEAISILNKTEKNFKYVIAGGGIELENLKKLSAKLKIKDKVEFLGPINREKIAELLSNTDIYFQPSVTEALSNSLIEASYYKIPIVSSQVGGIPEVVMENVTGFLSEIKSPSAYAENIKKLIDDEALRSKMGEKGRELILNKFSRKEELMHWKKLYTSLTVNKI